MNPDSLRKARLWLALVFLVGAAIGGVFGYSFGHRNFLAMATTPPISEPERRAKRVDEMSKEIGLSAEQSAKVDSIIHEAHAEMKDIRDKAEVDVKGVRGKEEADVDVVRGKARNEMRGLLTEEQKPKFEAMVARMDAERKRQQAGGAK
jgi:Spy/CpxP family protein refolding chaperone